jgi:mono/diheme cytochrome c family protein
MPRRNWSPMRREILRRLRRRSSSLSTRPGLPKLPRSASNGLPSNRLSPKLKSDNISCTGTETMDEIQKLGGGPPDAGHPYTVQDGKAEAKAYSGWVCFAGFCQVCHGPGGVGSAIAPDLAEALKHLNHKQFESIVSCGLKGNLGTGVMPAWGNNPNIPISMTFGPICARADSALGPGRPQKLGTSN